MRAEDGRSLAVYFIESMEENHLLDIVDAGLIKQSQEEEILGVANLAKRCLNSNGRNRPTMKEVAMELERIRAQHVNPSTLEQNHHPIAHVRTRSIRAWHDFSTSVRSETQITSSEFHLLMRSLER